MAATLVFMADAPGVESPVIWLEPRNLHRETIHDASSIISPPFGEAVAGQRDPMTAIDV
jgi:hypothetical protein